MFKVIIADIDGTLAVNAPNSAPSPKIITAVMNAKNKYLFSVATGRTYWYAKKTLKLLDINIPCIVSGGAQIINPKTEKIIWQQLLDMKIAEKVIKICREQSSYIFINNKKLNKVDSYPKQVEYIFVGHLNQEQSEALKDKLQNQFNLTIQKIPAWKRATFGFFITHPLANKKNALEKLTNYLNVSSSEIIGIGDGNNDLDLFEAVALKVAMSNGMDQLKETADLVIPSVEEDGVASFLDALLTREISIKTRKRLLQSFTEIFS